jgi:fructose-specific phosphotransferase system IIC component
MLASNLGMGFWGGILSGFLAGYIVRWIRDKGTVEVTATKSRSAG